jgi:hypothetical protein
VKTITERVGYASKTAASKPTHTTPLNAMSGSSGSLIDDNAVARRFSMVANLAYRSYTSSTLWHTFLKDIPDVVTSEHVSDLHKKDEWKKYMDSCIGGANSNPFSSEPSGSNEKEFRKLVQCVVELEGLAAYFGETQETTEEELEMDNPR